MGKSRKKKKKKKKKNVFSTVMDTAFPRSD